MELIWTAFVLGLVGSIHCAAMCGPLVIAVTNATSKQSNLQSSRLLYHLGRMMTYGAIGVLFGAVGKTFALVGLQRWLSITAGTVILAGLLVSSRGVAMQRVTTIVIKLKSAFGHLLQRRTRFAQFLLGSLNGLLPCGLVYIAAAGAATTLSPWVGAAHMAAFGLGTLPMMFGLALAGRRIGFVAPFRRLIPASIALVGVLLLLRGMALGIPYVSPALDGSLASCH